MRVRRTRGGITKIEVDEVTSPAFGGQEYGDVGQYEIVRGRAYGEADPKHPQNAIIQDIELAPTNEHGMVEYVATFELDKPIDMSRSSGLIWHNAPTRGRPTSRLAAEERQHGDVWLASGWQGDGTAQEQMLETPIAQNPDGSSITGQVFGRIVNAEGVASAPVSVLHSAPMPYEPLTLDTTQATLTKIESETPQGELVKTCDVPGDQWAWAHCAKDNPFPGTPDPGEICIDGGFEPNRAYQVVFTVKDPPILGLGFAAYRDIAAFFKSYGSDDLSNPNPLGGDVEWVIGHGQSQAGRFLRHYTHLGFNQDTHGRQVHDGLWIQGAGARISLNVRFAMPSGHLTYHLPGAEGPQWWHKWPDPTRDLPSASLLDRCRKTNTCPKIIETFSSGEMWSLQTSPTLVGTDARADIPEPTHVRRYYMPCGGHHGGFVDGSFGLEALPPPPSGPRNPTGGLLPASSLSYLETYKAIRHHVRNWVTKNLRPPPSRVPKLHGENACLVAPTKEAMGFPDIPGIPENAPTGLMREVLDYDFGPEFDYLTGSGIITKVPPKVRQIIPSLVPRVDEDGNEVATSGVPIVQHMAPLGTYLGWNIVASGFSAGRLCDMRDGMIPFAKTKAERLSNGDPRLSLEERYGDHAGWVAAVKRAATHAVKQGFLLPDDAKSIIQRAQQANQGWPTQSDFDK